VITVRVPVEVLIIAIIRKVRRETAAAQAQAEAPNSRVAHQVEENAEHAQQAAEKAAQAAQVIIIHVFRQ
jgi:hypothetical protein